MTPHLVSTKDSRCMHFSTAFVTVALLTSSRYLNTSSRVRKSPSKPLRPFRAQPARRCHPLTPIRRIAPKLSLSLPITVPKATVAALRAAGSAATPFALWAVLICGATLGLTMQRYQWGRALTPPLVATTFTLVLSSFGLLPVGHPIYSAVTAFIVPLSVPLILLGADLRRVVTQTGRLLPVFLVGSVASCIGTLGAWYIVPIKASLGDAAWKIAAALTARHIGGAVNYVAVADVTSAPQEVVLAAQTADNIIVALYFVLLLLLARNVTQPPVEHGEVDVQDVNKQAEEGSGDDATGPIQVKDAAVALSLSAMLCTAAKFISPLLPLNLGVTPIVTLLVVAVATAFPKQLEPYQKAATALGIFFLQIFFAVAGAGCSLVTVIRRAPILLIFTTMQILIHLAVLLVIGRIVNFHKSHVLLSSNANIGGPATAAAMARAMRWDRLVLPALLVGILGYSIATFVSLGLGAGLLRHL